jgi:hypothetical protein
MDNKIFMHFPIEIEKGEDGTYKRVIVKGKASTPHQDKQGEWIDPMGCDIDDFKRISDDHIKGNSGTIGEIIKAHKDHEAVWIDEAELYPSLPQVQHIVKIADELKKRPNSKMQLSFSIEGSATERDSINPKRILKAKLTGAAVTLQPINQNATAELFAKSLNYDDSDFDALEKSDNIEQKRYLYEWKDSDGVEYKLTKSFEIEKSQIHKYISKKPNGKGGWNYEYGQEGTPISIEEIDKRRQSLLDEVDPLIKLKKKLYSKIDISLPKSKEEKELDERIHNLLSEANDIVHTKRKFQNDQTQKSTTAELEDDDSEDVLKKEELKKKTVSLIAKAIEEKRISKEKGKKMLKHFLNQ